MSEIRRAVTTGGRVLVADDSPVSRMLAAAVLSSEGHQCDQAASVQEALELLAVNEYDVLLLDLDFGPGLPGGLELLKSLRGETRWDTLQIVVLTASGDNPSMITDCLDHGATDYITKPFDKRVLGARVARALRDRQRVVELAQSRSEARIELEDAAAVQRATRPKVPLVRGQVAVTGEVICHALIGGDLFDVAEDEVGRFSVFVVDAAGHGAAAGVVAAAARVALRDALAAGQELADVFVRVHQCLRGHVGVLEANAAVGIARFDESNHTLELLNAGLPPIVLCADSHYTAIPSMGPPLGFARQPKWQPVVMPLSADNVVAMFSDGATLQEVTEESSCKLADALGLQRFGAALALAPAEQIGNVLRETGATSAGDDATVVIAGAVLS